MNPRNRSFLLVLVGAGLTACVGGGAGAPPVGVEAAPLDVSRTFEHVMKHVSEAGEESFSAGLFCGTNHRHCKARIATDASGHPLISPRPGGGGGGSGVLGATDLQAAYGLDVTKTPNATVAIVDAYGYTNLESDLATYRSMYGLPACTTANGCLKIVNQQGQTSPLPKSDGQGCGGWNGETSLDVDMVSAACPNCKILVVLTDDADESMMPNLEMGQKTAAMLGATVISDSWGGADTDANDIMMSDKYFDVSPAKTGIFVASGDDAWNNENAGQGQTGPDFPSTSEFVIAVGGTTLKKSTSGTRGWTETVWSDGGSSCSPVIPTPTWQQGVISQCSFRAAVDVAADADPSAGSAVNTVCGGSPAGVGGTSAASPLVAAIFALYGHGENKGDFVYSNKTAWYDVTSGSNGDCGNIMCNAQAGWDGPTGLGTPNGKALGMIAPTDGTTPPDMAMPPDMATPPDMAEGTGGTGGEGGGGSGGSGGGTGTGGNGGSGGSGNGNHGGDSGCSMGGAANASGSLALFFVFGVAILGRALRLRRRA